MRLPGQRLVLQYCNYQSEFVHLMLQMERTLEFIESNNTASCWRCSACYWAIAVAKPAGATEDSQFRRDLVERVFEKHDCADFEESRHRASA